MDLPEFKPITGKPPKSSSSRYTVARDTNSQLSSKQMRSIEPYTSKTVDDLMNPQVMQGASSYRNFISK